MKIEAGGALNHRKPKPGADHRAAQHGKFAGARDEVDLEIVREHGVAGEIGDQPEAGRRNHHRHDGEAIEAVGQVHCVAGADNDEGAEQRRRHQPRLNTISLKNGNTSDVAIGGRPSCVSVQQATQCDHRFDSEPRLAGEAGVRLLGDLEVIVIEADQAEAQRHAEHDPDIGIPRVGPEQRRHDEARQDHQPAHGRRADLGDEMRFRARRRGSADPCPGAAAACR